MKRFFKKSVALILLSLVLSGFFVFGVEKTFAAAPVLTDGQTFLYTNPDYPNGGTQTWTYKESSKTWNVTASTMPSDNPNGIFTPNSTGKDITTQGMVTGYGFSQITGVQDVELTNPTLTIFDLGTAFGNIAKGITDAMLDGMLLTFLGVLTVVKLIVFGFLAITGSIFDGAIVFSIIHLGSLFNASTTLNIIWTMMRDFVNIFFIFIILYIAITIIIGSWGATSKITIVNVIIDAVLVNFSMFFTKVLIDAGNLVAVSLYNQINNVGGLLGTPIHGIGSIISTLFNFNAFLTSSVSLTSHTNMLIVSILQIIVIGIMVWVFIYGSFIIVGRSVMLILLAITSPLGFVFGSLPWITVHSKAWWKSLVDQLIVAPLLMFVLYIVVKLMSSGDLQKVATDSTSGAGATLTIGGYLYYIIIIVFLLEGMKLVTKYSGEVGAIATKIGGTALALGAAAITGGVAVGAGALRGLGNAEAGASAQLAGKTGVSAVMHRLQFGAGEGLKNVEKFASGKMEKEQAGPLGMITKFAREQVTAGTKGVTGGVLNIPDIIKKSEEMKIDSQERLKQSIVGQGLEKANKKKDSIDNIIKNIESEAKIKLATSQIGKDLESTGKVRLESLKNIDDIKDRKRNLPTRDADPLRQAALDTQHVALDKELADEKLRFSNLDTAYQARKKVYDTSLDMFKEDVAEEKGINGYVKINPATNTPYTQKGPEIEYRKDNNGRNMIDPATNKPMPVIDVTTGQPKLVINPATGQPNIVDIIDPKTKKPKLVKDYAAALKDMASAQADVITQEMDKVNSRLSDAMDKGDFFNTVLVKDDRDKVYNELKGLTMNKDLSTKLEAIIRGNKSSIRNNQPPAGGAPGGGGGGAGPTGPAGGAGPTG